MSDVTRSDYSPLVAEPADAPAPTTVPNTARFRKPNLVALAGLTCSAELLTVCASFWLSGVLCLRLVPSWHSPSLSFGAIICLLMIISIIERGDYGSGILLDRGLRPWSLAAALLQTVGVTSFLISLSFLGNWMPFVWPLAPEVLTGANAATLAVWTPVFLILCYPALLITRLAVRELSITLAYPQRVVVVGSPEACAQMVACLWQMPIRSARILGVIDAEEEAPASFTGGVTPALPILGNLADLLDMARRGAVDTVVINLPWSQGPKIRTIVESVSGTSIDVLLAPDLTGLNLPLLPAADLASMPLLRALYPPLVGWQALLKRLEDIIIAAAFTLLLAPLMLVVAVLIKLTSPGPVFFTQTRIGYGGQAFKVFKFRTMYTDQSDAHATVQTTRGDPRVTPIGAWLRRKSIDELPQLLNVLRGDMSLVGPRPHATGTTAGGVPLEQAAPSYLLRQRVRPGLTGWAQVNGKRGALHTSKDIVDRIAYDLDYIRNWSITFDLRILCRTFLLLSNDENAY